MQPQDPNEQNQPQQPPAGYQPHPNPQYPGQPPVLPEPQPQYQPQPPAQPGQEQAGGQPQQMYYTRPLEPTAPVMSEDIRRKCEESRKKYPKLNLSDGEFIVSDVKRHPIGMLQIWILVIVLIAAIFGVLIMLVSAQRSSGLSSSVPVTPLALGAGLLSILVVIGGYIGAFVYGANRFYLTNESVIQNIQLSLFANREQTVSLGNVEDASYHKHGIIQTLLDYGTIRLSTQGDETTYRFNYAWHPAKQVAKLNNAVEAFKNGRPVYDDDDSEYGER